MNQPQQKPQSQPPNPHQSPTQTTQKPPTQAPIPPQLKQPNHTFSFNSYYSTHYKNHHKTYLNKLKIRGKIFAIAGITIFVVGNIYPLMMWFQYDINVRKPRVSQYLLNRLN